MWKWKSCALFRPVIFATFPKDAALVEYRCQYKSSAHSRPVLGWERHLMLSYTNRHAIFGHGNMRKHCIHIYGWTSVMHNYKIITLRMSVCPAYQKKGKWDPSTLLWFDMNDPQIFHMPQSAYFIIRRAWMHVVCQPTWIKLSYQGETVILRVVLFKSYPLKMFLAHHELFTSTSHHECWLSDVIFVIVALCLYQRTVASNRRVQSQTILSPRRFGFWKGVKLIYCNVYNTGFIIHDHHTQQLWFRRERTVESVL